VCFLPGVSAALLERPASALGFEVVVPERPGFGSALARLVGGGFLTPPYVEAGGGAGAGSAARGGAGLAGAALGGADAVD
jgi:hypothetical protein